MDPELYWALREASPRPPATPSLSDLLSSPSPPPVDVPPILSTGSGTGVPALGGFHGGVGDNSLDIDYGEEINSYEQDLSQPFIQNNFNYGSPPQQAQQLHQLQQPQQAQQPDHVQQQPYQLQQLWQQIQQQQDEIQHLQQLNIQHSNAVAFLLQQVHGQGQGQNPAQAPSVQHAQATLRTLLHDNNFTLDLTTLKALVNLPIQALRVCKALAKMQSREADLLLHQMESVYGPATGLYTPKTWNTWYKNMWRILRWVAALAALSHVTVEEAAQQIDVLPARRNQNGVLIHFDQWRGQADARLAGLFQVQRAWNDSGAPVGAGNPPRMVDRMEQLAQGCDVQVY